MNLDKLRSKEGLKLKVDVPEADVDTTKDKKRTRIAAGIGALSAAAGAAVLTRNEKSLIGKGLIGVGAAAGLAASGFDSQAKQKTHIKEADERLKKTVREINMGRREGSPAIESFFSAIDETLDKNADWTKIMGDQEFGFYEESLLMQANSGQLLTVRRGITQLGIRSNFHSISVWDKGSDPRKLDATGTTYSVYNNLHDGINPRKILEGNRDESLPLSVVNATGEDTDYALAMQFLDDAKVVPEQ